MKACKTILSLALLKGFFQSLLLSILDNYHDLNDAKHNDKYTKSKTLALTWSVTWATTAELMESTTQFGGLHTSKWGLTVLRVPFKSYWPLQTRNHLQELQFGDVLVESLSPHNLEPVKVVQMFKFARCSDF